MVMRRYFFITSFFIVAASCGCNPYRFTVETQHPVDCRIFSDHNTVESNLYGFDMHPDAVIQVTSLAWTQYNLAAYLKLSGGEGFQIMLRPVVEESVIDSGLVLTFLSGGGVRLDSAGQTIDENHAFCFPKDSQVYVTIYNEESYLQMTIGCDTVLKRYTKRKSSDDIVLKTLPGSELKVLEPQWKRIRFLKNDDVKTEDIK
jgi:hypothetical protein